MAEPERGDVERTARAGAEKIQPQRRGINDPLTPADLEQGQRNRHAIQAVAQGLNRTLDDVAATVKQISDGLDRLEPKDPATNAFKEEIIKDLNDKLAKIVPKPKQPEKAAA
jgi:hypothetical protein